MSSVNSTEQSENDFPPELRGIGKRIADGRDVQGLSQQRLAEAVGVNRTAVVAWESERRPPEGAAVLVRLAAALRCSLDYLLTGKEDERYVTLKRGILELLASIESPSPSLEELAARLGVTLRQFPPGARRASEDEARDATA